jgi:3-methyladenine DNA glycosylase AlkC
MKAETTFSLKDQLFNREKVAYLGGQIARAYPGFAQAKFTKAALSKIPELELKARIVHLTECLENHLPECFIQSCKIILNSLPPELDPQKTDDDFGDFILAPLSHFVVRNGNHKKHLKRSLHALREITKRFSAEDAIRYFINQFPEETFEFLEKCAVDPNYHVRRLASEGSRPKLPWSQKLITPHQKPLPILHQLHKDPTRYVTRSVANHLNDISKIEPDLVLKTLQSWQQSALQSEKELGYMTRHALRTLIKKSHPGALKLLGFNTQPAFKVLSFKIQEPTILIGEPVVFVFELYSTRSEKLVIDYLMEFPDHRSKVFKIKQLELTENQVVTIEKRHPLKLMTTRDTLSGKHKITLQINGQRYDSAIFELTA